nr:actinia tenebrosa protease inhibitors-like [Parasteatoda tepidariorum]
MLWQFVISLIYFIDKTPFSQQPVGQSPSIPLEIRYHGPQSSQDEDFNVRDCPANSHYTTCGTACPLTCENYLNPPKICILVCKIGCKCDEGYVLKDGSCVLPEHCPAQAVEKSCSGEAEPGVCKGHFPSWYFDTKSGICKRFIYGGCGGNGNRYATEQECLQTCTAIEKSCSGEPETDVCDAYFPSWYYESKSGSCKRFVYGGCGGNGNRYDTEEECLQTCSASTNLGVCFLTAERGPCYGLFHRYAFDRRTGQCKEFIYGGCGGNGNNFITLEECENTCLVQRALDRPDCDKKADPGFCSAYIPRYYYDQEEGMCKKFIYGGCGGNRNNFATEDECNNKCGPLVAPKVELCEQEKKTGPCRGYFPRYYYNKQTGECEKFIYGGCRGNDNNFSSQDNCEQVCKGVYLNLF